MKVIFLVLFLAAFSLCSCHNDKPVSSAKEELEKKEAGYWIQQYKDKDIDTYLQWFCQEFPMVSQIDREMKTPSHIDTLSGNRVLLGVSHRPNTDLLFCIKDIKTKKFYSIFLLQGSLFYGKFFDGIKEKFQSETQECKNRIRHVVFSYVAQMKLYQYDIQRLLERQTINDTLPPNAIEAFFDEIFLALKNPKHIKIQSFGGQELFFNKDTNLVSIKRFLNTKRARELPEYEKIKYMTMFFTKDNFTCYEIKKDTYILIFKSRKIHSIEMYVFGELINFNDAHY